MSTGKFEVLINLDLLLQKSFSWSNVTFDHLNPLGFKSATFSIDENSFGYGVKVLNLFHENI